MLLAVFLLAKDTGKYDCVHKLWTGLTGHLANTSNRLLNEAAFDFIPPGDQARGGRFRLEESAPGGEGMIANGPLPPHQELCGTACLLDVPTVAIGGPVPPLEMRRFVHRSKSRASTGAQSYSHPL
jgi:hypothetical protein